MKKKGISLIMLVITIIVIIILAAAVILTLFNSGISDKAIRARFMNDFRTVQEAVNIYAASNYNSATSTFALPLKGYLSSSDKSDITNNVPTLKTKIEQLSGSIDTVNLAWIDTSKINVTLLPIKQDKGYIIDVDSKQIYDYVGDFFEELRWHTLDGGIAETGTTNTQTSQEMWDGWMTLTLYYPANSTARQWRLGTAAGTAGDLRADPITMWQDYTGPIRVPIDRVQDVWIRYMLNNTEVTIPPAGTLLVDIVPDKTGATKVPQVNVSITYDSTADTKEYRVGSSAWMPYNGPFVVTENCVVEARATKTDYVYNTDGSLLTTRQIAGKDMVYIGNIGIEESDLPAPTITRVAPSSGSEVAGVQVTYPADAVKKIYKINYGAEQNYTNTISIPNYGEYIIAYYYDASGKRSLSSSIYINDTSTGPAQPPSPYIPNPPYIPTLPPPSNLIPPEDIIPAPTVNVSPTSLTSSVQVSVTAPSNADKIYIKLGRYGNYQSYTTPITVRQNMEVYAYYSTYTGDISNTGHGVVSNIQQPNMPYVYIDANPYPWSGSYGASNVTVTVNSSNANTVEYSEDGIVYQPYTASFTVNQNETVYARATNSYGTTETSLNITNIGQIKAPTPVQNLNINIAVNPEPTLSTNQVLKANVTIDYDSKATEKYYTIGKYGTLKTYTGPFDVTSNCTVYAYAKATNAKGSSSKVIDNISSGISEPIISSTPGNSLQASKDSITITFDKNAKIKRYSINGGTLSDYVGAFDVTTNGAVIYAYSQNALGQTATSTYTVQNIVPEPPVLVLDLGQYYILKLNYPDGSKTREYKWKADGVWKTYPEAGIMLIKPEYQNQLIQNGTLVKIKDETGNLVTFTGDYYLIDVPINELSENIFMRWDRVPLPAPQIIIDPTTAAKQVTVTIAYNSGLVKKQYRIIAPDGSIGAWQDYTGPFTIDRNNTAIDANGMDETEVWTPDAMLKITNIDENPPVIALTADLIAAQQQVAVKVHVTDDVAVGKVKWAAGTQGESYFKTAGTEVMNDSIVNITSNGYYTFYAEDQVGNTQVYTLNVTNVDLTPPAIDIAISPTTVGTSATATINYGDSTTKQYKIGTSNSTWSTYTAPVSLSSYTILSNNWQNSDGTVTIYAKGTDSAGNAITVQKVVLNLDLDAPKAPVVHSNSGYPLLNIYGVQFDKTTTITYDTRTDINNYYSIDNGATWLTYTGQFDMSNGTVIAKSVKKNTGLEVSVSQTIAMPADALKAQAYDYDDTTYISNSTGQYMLVDSSMQGQNIRIKWDDGTSGGRTYITFQDVNKQLISTIEVPNLGKLDQSYTIPMNTRWIVCNIESIYNKLYEIDPSNEPVFSVSSQSYMLLTADPTKAIKQPYQMVSVSYYGTSIQKLYKIGTNGTWLNYNDQPIKVNQGETIYAKGIDEYGNETRITSSYTVNITDALKLEAYDGNDSTFVSSIKNQYMDVDSSMLGKNIRIKWADGTSSGRTYISFLDINKTVISTIEVPNIVGTIDQIYTVPTNTRWMLCNAETTYNQIYEIQPSNEPTFTATNGYMLITADSTKAITKPYQMVSINYFATSVQKLYQIGSTSGTWLNYTGQPVKVNQGDTIYAKGIDIYGNQTRIISSYTPNVIDALKSEAFDGNDTTYVTNVTNQYMQIDSSMQGKKIRVKWADNTSSGVTTMTFLNSNKQTISTVSVQNIVGIVDQIYTIPTNAVWMVYNIETSNNKLYEIQASNEPTFSTVNVFMLLTADVTKAIKSPYQMVSISYFPTSVQRLYMIGTSGTWINYVDQPIKVNQGETIYAKGIDQYGNETRITSSYTVNMTNALKPEAYDGNDTTYVTNVTNQYMEVESSMQGKNVRIRWSDGTSSGRTYMVLLDANNVQVGTFEVANIVGLVDTTYTLPANVKYIVCNIETIYNKLYEIQAKP